MLVLSRKTREAVGVGEKNGSDCLLKISVLEIKGNCVRLGFEAAAEVPVHRWELWERLHPNCLAVELSEGGFLDGFCSLPSTPDPYTPPGVEVGEVICCRST
jgi:carbon storage regulator CsrA